MGTIQKLSSQVIDYAERVSEMADAAQGKHHRRAAGLPSRWLVLPASGAALYALVRSDSLSRPAKQVVDGAKARASELPDELLSMVRQTTSSSSSRNGSGTSSSTSARRNSTSKSSARRTGAARRKRSVRKTTASR